MNLLLLTAITLGTINPGPECLSEPGRSASFRTLPIELLSGEALLAGNLYLPQETGRYPGIVMMHGGGGNVENLRSTPVFMAEMMVRCGFAVVVYDKRGTGDSGGDYASSTFDDFVEDAGAAGHMLSRHAEVDNEKIGVIGFSQGGRLAPVAAVRFPLFAFAASVSGPIATVKETRLWAMRQSFVRNSVSEEVIQRVMPLWVSHLDAVAENDLDRLAVLDSEAAKVDDGYNGALRPPPIGSHPVGGIYNSMGQDYTEELTSLKVPWYALYGGADLVVPVETSTANIDRIKRASGNLNISYKVVPDVGHSFSGPDGTFHRFDLDIIDWAMAQAEIETHPAGGDHH